MTLFVVAYDLKETTDSEPLRDALENLDSVHTQLSVWYVSRSGTAGDLLDHLKPHTGKDDKLMVVEFTKRPRYTKAKPGTNDWLDRHFG